MRPIPLYLATLPQPPANEDLRFLKPGYLRKRSLIEYFVRKTSKCSQNLENTGKYSIFIAEPQ